METKLNVVEMPIDDVIPYDKNPRLNDDAVDAVAESISNYGWRQPIVVDKDNVIICGHTRRLAALKLGLKTVPVVIAADLSPEKVRAYRLDDNKTAELATWDFAKLQEEIIGLQEDGYDMSSLAFGQEEIDRLLNDSIQEEEQDKEGETDPDSVKDVSENEYDSVIGGIYQLGKHRLVCGDCCEGLDITKLFEGDGDTPVKLWLTDPPYNVAYEGKSGKQGEAKEIKSATNPDMKISNDSMTDEEFETFLMKAFENCAAFMENGASFYIFHSWVAEHIFRKAIIENGFDLRNQLIWAKNHLSLSWGCYMMKHEPIYFGWKKGAPHRWFGAHDNSTTTIQEWNIIQKCDVHPTMKPTDMLKYFIKNSTESGDMVMDTFGGSGSTLIACEETGRVCRIMEIMPKYADVIRKRWAEFVHGEGCDWKNLAPKIGVVM